MKILFINPPQSSPLNAKYSNLKIPLGFLYIAGVLEKNNFSCKILDCPLYYQFKRKTKNGIKIGLYPEQIKKEIQDYQPDVIGISCSFSMYEQDSFEIINLIKKNFPKIIIVVGGAHSSANPEFVLRNKNIDLVVIGEGERTMLEIAKKLEQGKRIDNIPGTAARIKGKIKFNKKREYIKNLDEIVPAWHLINLQDYFKHPDNSLATMRKNSIDIVTSRGCPGNCVFCSIHTVWGKGWRARSAGNVVDEIEFLVKKYGARQFRIQDDNFTFDKKRALEICNEIIKRKLDIKWDTPNGIALWSLDKEILLKMKQAGCYRVTFGVESACQETQKYIGKILKLEKIEEMIDYCHEIGLWVCSTFIIGFPFEKSSDIQETERFIINSKINFPFIYIAQPYQGTRMYNDFKNSGLIQEKFIEKSNIVSSKYNTTYLKSEELNNLRARIYKEFYLNKLIKYLNPSIFYSEFLSKLHTFEDWKYAIRMLKAVIFKL